MTSVGLRRLPVPRGGKALALISAAAVFVLVLCGYAVAGGPRVLYLLLALLLGGVLWLVFIELPRSTFLAWLTLAPVMFPLFSALPGGGVLSWHRGMLAGMASWIFARPRRFAASKSTTWMTLFLLMLVATFGLRAFFTTADAQPVFQSDPRQQAITTWFDGIVLPTAAFLIANRFFATARSARVVLGCLTVLAAGLGALGAAQAVLGFSLAELSGGVERFDANIGLVRVSGPYNVPEVYAVVLLVSLAGALWWAQNNAGIQRAAGWAAVTLAGAGIIATYFRSVWIGGLLILVAGLALRRGEHGRTFAVLSVLGVVGALLFSEVRGNDVFQNRVNNVENISGRFATYEVSLELFRRNTAFGVGVDQYPNAQATVPQPIVDGVRPVPYPHSSYFGVLSEQGVFGIVPLLLCTLGVALVIGELRRRARAAPDVVLGAVVLGAAIAYLLMSLTLTMLPYGESNAFFLALVGLAAGRCDALAAGAEEPAT